MSRTRKYARLSDWLAVRDLGLDPGLRPADDPPPSFDPTLGMQPQPRHYFPPGFELHPPRSRGGHRSRQVDALLATLGVRPRAR